MARDLPPRKEPDDTQPPHHALDDGPVATNTVAADTAAAAAAQKMVEEVELGARKPQGVLHWLIIGLALTWSLFQLSVASVVVVDAVQQRAIHVFFGITIAFLVFPAVKRNPEKRSYFQYISMGGITYGVAYAGLLLLQAVTDLSLPWWLVTSAALASSAAIVWSLTQDDPAKIPWYDIIFALIAGLTALYLVYDSRGIALRGGIALEREVWIGIIFILLLLEATRRSLGPALAIIATIFLLYQLTGPRGAVPWPAPYMPDLFAHAGASLSRMVSQQFVTTEGIFGIPVAVSTAFVFLFVLFGSMLDKAGAGKYFIDVANSLLGTFRGGPAKAAVVASGMTGMVSGSSLANVVTTGTFTIPLMKRSGYPAHKAAATEVAVSTNGQLMPPVMGAAAFIIAEFVGVPYLEVVRAAFVPAFVAYIALFYIVHLEALKLGLQGIPRSELPRRLRTFVNGLHFLLPILVLVYALVIQGRSPGFSVIQAIVVLAVLMVIQAPIKALLNRQPILPALARGFLTLFDGLVAGARNMVGIAVAVAAAGIIVGVVGQTGLGFRLTEIILTISQAIAGIVGYLPLLLIEAFGGATQGFENTLLFTTVLLITAVASLILGLGLPTTANYVVMAALTAPIIYNLGNDLGFGVSLLAAHLFVFFFGILADDTPPVGLAAYAAAAIARTDPIRTGIQGFTYDMRTAILPFMFIFNAKLLLMGVSGWLDGIHIFLSAVIGMFAFSAGTQGFMMRRTIWHERLVLLAIAFMLIQPTWTTDIIGLLLYGLVYLSQWYRGQHETPPAVTT